MWSSFKLMGKSWLIDYLLIFILASVVSLKSGHSNFVLFNCQLWIGTLMWYNFLDSTCESSYWNTCIFWLWVLWEKLLKMKCRKLINIGNQTFMSTYWIIYAKIMFLPVSKSDEHFPALLISERKSWFCFKYPWDGAKRNHRFSTTGNFPSRLHCFEDPCQGFWRRMVYWQNSRWKERQFFLGPVGWEK